MKKIKNIFTLIFIIALILSFTLSNKVFSQSETEKSPQQPGGSPFANPQQWLCMENRELTKDELKIIPDSIKQRGLLSRRRHVTARGLDPSACYYIVGCIDTTSGIQCTTGDNKYDEELGWTHFENGTNIGNYTYLNTSNEPPLPYTFIVEGGSYRCNPKDGRIETNVISATLGIANHTWFVVRILEGQQENKGADEETSTLHYGTFIFQGNPDFCAGTNWDPMGTVFDSQSLEPIAGVTLTILDATNNQPVQLPGVKHTKTTREDGRYSWLVEPGLYRINIVSMPPGFQYLDNPSVHPNYTKAYTNLLSPGEIIVEEEGKIAIADIPLTSNLPYRTEPKILNYKAIQTGSYLLIQGVATHPFTIIKALQDGFEIGTTQATKFGNFTIKLPNSVIDPEKKIDFMLEKVDLTKDEEVGTPAEQPDTKNPFESLLQKLIPNAYAQKTAALSIDPIPTYLEGYAYDKNGRIMPNATITVKLRMSNSAYYQTSADENGFFSIPPQYLPIINYYLEYSYPSQTGKPIVVSTTEFARANKNWLEANKIDIMSATKNGKSLIAVQTTENKPKEKDSTKALESTQKPIKETPTLQNQTKNNTMLFIIIALFIVAVLGAVLIYLRSKKNKTGEEPLIPQQP